MPVPASQALIAPGTVFAGDFRIDRLIGQGGMAQVFAAEQLSTGKLRALKLMHPTLVADDDHKRRFLREARAGGGIESDHVVSVQGAGVDADTGTPYIVMELLRGETLYDRVKRTGPLPFGDAAAIFRELGHAVAAAHAASVVHRDLKPENVFLAQKQGATAGATVKVLDFGIAKLLAEVGTRGTTGAMGSPLWMAPEQTEAGKISPAADVWAMGLLMFFMLTGKYFWLSARDSEATVTQLLREIIFEPLPTATWRARDIGVNVELPPGFDEWFVRCVQRDPAHRFANGSECSAAFESVFSPENVGIQATVLGDPISLPKVRSLPPAIRITPAAVGGGTDGRTIVDATSDGRVPTSPTMELSETVGLPGPADRPKNLPSGTPPPLSTSNKQEKPQEGTRTSSIGPWMLGSAALVAVAIVASITVLKANPSGSASNGNSNAAGTATSGAGGAGSSEVSAALSARPSTPTPTPTPTSTSTPSARFCGGFGWWGHVGSRQAVEVEGLGTHHLRAVRSPRGDWQRGSRRRSRRHGLGWMGIPSLLRARIHQCRFAPARHDHPEIQGIRSAATRHDHPEE
jgi:serine/threonine protein kinase